MKRFFSLLLAVLILSTSVFAAMPFEDMESAQWAAEAVGYLNEEGVVSGRSETIFAPMDNVTRAEFAKMVLALIKEKPEKDGIIKVACIGDSLTAGYADADGKYQTNTSYTDLLQRALGDGYEVKNFGKAAYGIYSEHEYSYTKIQQYEDSLSYEPDIVVSVFGSNDMRSIYWDVIKNDYVDIYKEFIRTYQQLPSNPEIIIGLPGPVYEGEYIKSRPVENQREAQAAILKAADELGVKVADTYTVLDNVGPSILPDGIHFNEEGARYFTDEIVKTILEEPAVENVKVSFEDVHADAWFADAVYKAAGKGIVNGYGNVFKPNDFITRQDAALIIFRALSLNEGGTAYFADENEISDYAKGAVITLASKGYISGVGNGDFAPKNLLTRAQAAQLIFNALK